jgi:hypothetical protein
LSCLKGNFHEQFLGGLAGAIPPGYPAGGSDITSLPNHLALLSTWLRRCGALLYRVGNSLISLTMRGAVLVVSLILRQTLMVRSWLCCAMFARLRGRRGWYIFCSILKCSLHFTGVRACPSHVPLARARRLWCRRQGHLFGTRGDVPGGEYGSAHPAAYFGD